MESEKYSKIPTVNELVDTVRELAATTCNVDFNELKDIVERSDMTYVCYLLRAAARKGIIRDVKYLTRIVHGYGKMTTISDAFCSAAIGAHLDVMEYLLKYGADVHHENDNALRIAVFAKYYDIVEFLLNNGADVNIENGALILECCKSSDYAHIMEALIYYGINVLPHYHDALNLCYKNNNTAGVQTLIQWSSTCSIPKPASPSPSAREFEEVLNLRESQDIQAINEQAEMDDSDETDSQDG